MERPNLKVLADASVSRIKLSESDGEVVADAVEFEYGGKIHTVKVRKEAVLAAGFVCSAPTTLYYEY